MTLWFLGVNEPSASAQLAKIDTVTAKNGPQGDEFDMFAQSRKVTYESSKAGYAQRTPQFAPLQRLVSGAARTGTTWSQIKFREDLAVRRKAGSRT